MNVTLAIQTHPARADLADQLAAQVPGCDVVSDPTPDTRPGAWRTYRACMDTTPAGATHRVIVQDDVLLADGFADAALAAVAARPDRLLAFYHGGVPQENRPLLDLAASRGETWVELSTYRVVPVVALAWPARLIRPVLEFVDRQAWPPQFSADDEIIGHALRDLGETYLACVPSIVQHPDRVPSLLGLRAWAGEDPGRVAHRFTGAAAGIDWTTGDR